MGDKLIDSGYIQVYTGMGKGKTTAALGLALRAVGAGLNVYIGQFMKGIAYNEVQAASAFNEKLVIEQYGEDSMVHPDAPRKEDLDRAKSGLEKIRAAMLSGKYQLVIFDEINVTCNFNILKVEDVLEVLKQKPDGVEIVLTGINAPDEFIEIADLVSEMKELKHYYREKGILSRNGIDR